ncbi:interferon alpha/beta receptor 1 isoform X2 [Ochotona princeps]|uniref:interferon alpha/beta receptor 1 isoform X2 n=1 Tax=Ochotona princeps TaxID=9978 RepID=UPI0027146BBF|nr:interferon alpha/beta receptor 1 isoform X2 [Ochotona princeps]
MLPLLGATTLVLVVGTPWVSPAAADEHQLESPHHVQVYIIDDNFTLKWNRSNEAIPNVTFSADYQTSEMNDWTELPGCQYIMGTSCTFSLPNVNVFDEIKFRIRAERGNSTSAWHSVDSFIPFHKAQIGPLKVHLEAEDKAIIISITPPMANMWLTESPWFTYHVVIWKNSSSTEERTLKVYPRDTIYKLSPATTYCLKVRAEHRKQRKLDIYSPVDCATTKATIPPPVLNVKTTGDALHAYVGTSQEPTDLHGSLIYEIIYWENTSSTERKIRQERNDFTFPDLKPLTLYCFKARALMGEEPNQSSDFTDVICEKIKPGDMSRTWLIAAVCTVLPLLLVLTYIVRGLLRYLSSVFFPSPKPPSSIAECLSEQRLENLLLPLSEEKTEQCFVIEGATVIPREEDINSTDEDLKKYSSQTSQDSGNYSNEDESRSKTSVDSLHLESG